MKPRMLVYARVKYCAVASRTSASLMNVVLYCTVKSASGLTIPDIEGAKEGGTDGTDDGGIDSEGKLDGGPDGEADGIPDNDNSSEGHSDGPTEGYRVGASDGTRRGRSVGIWDLEGWADGTDASLHSRSSLQ